MLGIVVSVLGLLHIPSQLPALSPLERDGRAAWCAQMIPAVTLQPSPSSRGWVNRGCRVGAGVLGGNMVSPDMQGLGLLWWAHLPRLYPWMVAREQEARAEDRSLKQEVVLGLKTCMEQSCFVNSQQEVHLASRALNVLEPNPSE